MVTLEVPADHVGLGVQPLSGQSLPEFDDQLDRALGKSPSVRSWHAASEARTQRHRRRGSGRHLLDGGVLDNDGGGDQTGLEHTRTSNADALPLVDGVRYVSRHRSGMS
jgi:hypothetical protein